VTAAITEIAERFARDVSYREDPAGRWRIRAHEMTVLHDDGLYRHLRFRSPDAGSYWFDLITWPGSLTISGDCGTYTFAREADMFGFFRGHRVNPDYWAEKVSRETKVSSYSEDQFREQVAAEVKDADQPGLAEAVESDFYGILAEWDTTCEAGARQALDEFAFYKSESDRYDPAKEADFRFEDTWEWDLSDWDWTFLWCLHAIVWGIARYDKQRAAVAA
jgi:hypothetical protein